MTTVKNANGKKIKVSPGTKGAISEHIATAWLLQQGYDVFRNVAPTGRADLLAVNWDRDETIRVDVKSHFFLNGRDKRSLAEEAKIIKNEPFDIRYIVVSDAGSCRWHDGKLTPTSDNDNLAQLQWWKDKKTLQRFQTPGNYMSNKGWTFFCHWLVRAYPDFIFPFSARWVEEIASRYTSTTNHPIGSGEVPKLEKLFKHVYDKLIESESIVLVEDFSRASA